jgi:hypothetical protein
MFLAGQIFRARDPPRLTRAREAAGKKMQMVGKIA